MARIKAIEINDIKLLGDSFLAGSIGSIGELETSIREWRWDQDKACVFI